MIPKKWHSWKIELSSARVGKYGTFLFNLRISVSPFPTSDAENVEAKMWPCYLQRQQSLLRRFLSWLHILVKGCHVTAALLAKENQKTFHCPLRKYWYNLGQETGLQAALRLKEVVSWKRWSDGLRKGKGWFLRRLSCSVIGHRQSPSQSAFQNCVSCCWLYGSQLH